MISMEGSSKWEPPVDRKYDWVGPPDSESKIRTVKFCRPFQESKVERNFRFRLEAVQKWNHDFWARHNQDFEKEKLEFVEKIMIERKLARKSDVDSEMMSEFYSKFLNDRRSQHWEYNLYVTRCLNTPKTRVNFSVSSDVPILAVTISTPLILNKASPKTVHSPI